MLKLRAVRHMCVYVSGNDYDCGAEKVRMRVCVCAHLPFGLSRSDCPARVAATSRPQLVFFLDSKTSAGTSDGVVYGDRRHVCDDEVSHHEDVDGW